MRFFGLFLVGFALVLTGLTGTAAAQGDGPNFKNLLKATAPRPDSGESGGDDAQAKREEYHKKMEEARSNAAQRVQGYDEELGGFLRFGNLTCAKGLIKIETDENEIGQKCIEPTPIEGGRWKNGRLLCDSGRQHIMYLDGTQECQSLPEVADGFYEYNQLKCNNRKYPVMEDGELVCRHESEIASMNDIVYQFNYCPENFEKRQLTCFEKEAPGQVKAGYTGGGSDTGGSGLNLNPYE